MPVSNDTTVRAKKVIFGVEGRSARCAEAGQNDRFLTIGPALPALPGASVPPKLSKRALNAFSPTGTVSDVQDADIKDCDAITLRWAAEGRTVLATRNEGEREKNPDRICLDRRGLTTFPTIVGEPKLRLLSLQHNLLAKLDGGSFSRLTKLVFLDLYDNQIEKVSSLEPLESLRVLLIGKNRIKRIEGLKRLSKLEVLDLHGNQIAQITGLEDLASLKVLNLAGNNVRAINCNDFQGLTSLKELNLRRNRIKSLHGFGETPQLQKLYLSNNDVRKIEDMGSIAKALQIREITIDGNPVSLSADYASFLVSYLPNLQLLSDLSAQVCRNTRREEVISNAKTNWELLRYQSRFPPDNGRRLAEGKGYNVNALHVQRASKFNGSKAKSLERTKSKGFGGSLGSINEHVEAKRMEIKRRSNSSESLLKLDDNARAYRLEFKLPPIVGSIVDNLTRERLAREGLSEDGKGGFVFEGGRAAASDSGADSESSESHESLKTGLRSNLRSGRPGQAAGARSREGTPLARARRGERQERYPPADVRRRGSSFPKGPVARVELESGPSDATLRRAGEERRRLPRRGSREARRSDNEEGELEPAAKSNESSSGYCSFGSKTGSLDSCKSLPSDASGPPWGPEAGPGGSGEQEGAKTRLRSAQPRKVLCYKSNRAATARAKYAALPAPPSPPPLQKPPSKEREQGGDYLIEIVGRCLNVYGQGALRFIDRPWDCSKSLDVNAVKFNYVQFNEVAKLLSKLKSRFPNAEHFSFKETNVAHLGQLNALAEVQGLRSLSLEAGNPIVSKNWKTYAIFRLAHWGLASINGKEITKEEMESANREYAGLVDIVMSCLPESLLQPLLHRLHLEKAQRQSGERITAKEFLFKSDPALRSVVAKEALQWRKGNVSQEDLIWRHKGKVHLLDIINHTVEAIQKLERLRKEWPSILRELIRDTLFDFSEMDEYMKRCTKRIEMDK
ncbi:hypothetical protein KM043_000503 [Ampulex compressa]|nr:hypothetical protein KM043_000503 [Ampulex compressa]